MLVWCFMGRRYIGVSLVLYQGDARIGVSWVFYEGDAGLVSVWCFRRETRNWCEFGV